MLRDPVEQTDRFKAVSAEVENKVMMTYIYKYFFGNNTQGRQFGYGAALTVVTAVILTIVTLFYLRVTHKSSEIY